MKVESAEKVEKKFRESIECARNMGFPIFELRGLLSLQKFLGANRKDIEIEARLKKLAHLQNLDRRVDAAIKARGYKLRAMSALIRIFRNRSCGYAWSICRPLFSFAGIVRNSFPDKSTQRFGPDVTGLPRTIKNSKGLRAIRSIDEGQIGDAYIDGDIDIDGDMLRPFELRGAMKDFHPLVAAWRFIQPLLFGQVHTNRRAIGAHYDIDPTFFLSFLDPGNALLHPRRV